MESLHPRESDVSPAAEPMLLHSDRAPRPMQELTHLVHLSLLPLTATEKTVQAALVGSHDFVVRLMKRSGPRLN